MSMQIMPMRTMSTQKQMSSPGKSGPWIVQRDSLDPAGVIRSGLDRLFALQASGAWGADSSPDAVGSTAYVLARLAELPGKLLSHSRVQEIQHSLDWLVRSEKGIRLYSSEGDCFTTALVVIALRSYGRRIPDTALNFLVNCCVEDGSFATAPRQQDELDLVKAIAVTATACKALEQAGPQTEEFLIRHIQSALRLSPGNEAAGLYVCSEILDWPTGLASMSLLNKVSQLTCKMEAETAYGQALLLRSLLRLRISRSWPVAARLREMQAEDGNWSKSEPIGRMPIDPASALISDANEPVVLATAISALAMADSQPGLYFGSDLPLPQRF
jgi:hypothetical protein